MPKAFTYKFTGYLPAAILSKLLSLWDNDIVSKQIPIWRLICEREKGGHKQRRTPLPFIEVVDQATKYTKVDYSYLRHARLRLDQLKKALSDEAVGELVVKELIVGIPRDLVYTDRSNPDPEDDVYKRDKMLAAVFSHTFVERDDKRREDIKKLSKDEFKHMGFKHSCLDLTGLIDSGIWRKGKKKKYDVIHDIHTIRLVMRALDPKGMWGYGLNIDGRKRANGFM